MAETISVIFSIVALICGLITLYWLMRLKKELPMETHGTYITSALIAISFLVSFPLWNLFLGMFTTATDLVRQVSYLFFSAGYFGVLLVAHMSVKSVVQLKGKVKTLDSAVKRRKKIDKWAKEKEQ